MTTTINLTQQFYDEKDQPVIKYPEKVPYTIKHALEAAMIETPPMNPGDFPTAEVKLARYYMWKRLKAAESEITLTPEDVALLKRAAGAAYTPLFYGSLIEMLDGTYKPPLPSEAGA